MQPRLSAFARWGGSVGAALCAVLVFAACAHATPTTNTLPPQNVTTNAATLEGQGKCDPGATCKAYFHWRQTGGTWYNAATVAHSCTGSNPCAWSQSAPLTGLLDGTSYVYVLCSNENTSGYACYGPDGTTQTKQVFTTKWLPPTNNAPPTISGTASEYDTLYENHGSWTQSPTSYSYQWYDCTIGGVSCTPIAGATHQSYILQAGDVNQTIEVQEVASNSGGSSAPATSSATALVAASPIMSTTGSLSFDGSFQTGVSPWTATGGNAQCANYGTSSTPPRLRGNLSFVSDPTGMAGSAGEITLPTDGSPSTYTLEACDLVPASQPLNLGADQYYGIMVYVPVGWRIPNNSFWGIAIKEFHFQNIWGSPIEFQLHPNHVTVAVETGGCNAYTTTNPGCEYRSNADSGYCPNTSGVVCLPSYYAIPPGALVQGKWNEIVMHVHWASDATGQFQTWYRTAGASTWTESSSMNGDPTIQWDNSSGCCSSGYVELTEAYGAAMTAPVNVWLRNDLVGTGFASVASAMP